MKLALLIAPLALLACTPSPGAPGDAPTPEAPATVETAPADAFFARLDAHCGKTYEGAVVTDDPLDADFANQRLIMTVASCAPDEVRIPFHVGSDRSRTWVLTRTPQGVRLKHDHRHDDGTEDVLSQYGGDTADMGSDTRQEFPADGFSKDLFLREGIPASVDNVWAMEVNDQTFAYELRRPNRFFRVEFDLTEEATP